MFSRTFGRSLKNSLNAANSMRVKPTFRMNTPMMMQ
jgi:hypothetical protein